MHVLFDQMIVFDVMQPGDIIEIHRQLKYGIWDFAVNDKQHALDMQLHLDSTELQ